ncbi:type II toxin-antitoxin system RelE family toxin [Pelistega europaea]|uniref:Type II toxin-antitoxin system RelE/ParE family toxin n=1 Tax=Pelistega europaea TaxID=106147 RepID=A0A7Y4P473_9BURK|nr:type II toxin-antitoxin system RelE/ParE family toxin [Pelistega europaea]NOL49201.1 type II toxin-antitoxin system RelE/ParE family toxin [Pelistega europaea]
MNKVTWSIKAYKQLSKIDTRYRKAIEDSVKELKNFPHVNVDLKKLVDRDNQYRIRVGRYRVIFEVMDGVPKIIEITAVLVRDSRTYS